MIEKDELNLFINQQCKIILSNGFTYTGILRKINNSSILFEDRFDGLKILDISIIKGIGQLGGKHE